MWNTGNSGGQIPHIMVSFGVGACGMESVCGVQNVVGCWPDFYTPISNSSSVTQTVWNKKAVAAARNDWCTPPGGGLAVQIQGQSVSCQNDYPTYVTDPAPSGC